MVCQVCKKDILSGEKIVRATSCKIVDTLFDTIEFDDSSEIFDLHFACFFEKLAYNNHQQPTDGPVERTKVLDFLGD